MIPEHVAKKLYKNLEAIGLCHFLVDSTIRLHLHNMLSSLTVFMPLEVKQTTRRNHMQSVRQHILGHVEGRHVGSSSQANHLMRNSAMDDSIGGS